MSFKRQKPAGERQDTASMPTWSMTKGVQAHNEQRNKQASSLPDSLPPPIHNSHQAMNTADRQLHGETAKQIDLEQLGWGSCPKACSWVGAAALELAQTRTLSHQRCCAIAGTRTQSSEEPLIQHVIVVHNTTPIPTVVCPYCHRGPSPTIQYKVRNMASLDIAFSLPSFTQ